MRPEDAVAAFIAADGDEVEPITLPPVTLTGADARLFKAVELCLRGKSTEQVAAELIRLGLHQFRTGAVAIIVGAVQGTASQVVSSVLSEARKNPALRKALLERIRNTGLRVLPGKDKGEPPEADRPAVRSRFPSGGRSGAPPLPDPTTE